MSEINVRTLKFQSSVLHRCTWNAFDIEGPSPGPLICVMAGVHVNEVSSIEAAFQLRDLFAARLKRGRVSLLPIVNLPAVPVHAEFVCPIDGKNINFSFPGRPDGSFSEALADALLNEWAADAECLIDLHGGDLCERVARFTVAPLTGRADFDARTIALAEAFAPEILVKLPPSELDKPGRSCSGRVCQGRHAAFAEAGGNGLLQEDCVAFHRDGVLRVAGLLGMIDDAPTLIGPAPFVAERYHWLGAETDGWCVYKVEPGESVAQGQPVAEIHDLNRRPLRTIEAPAAGRVLWRCTHPLVTRDTQIMGIGSAD